MTELQRVWGDRIPDGGNPRPDLTDELYAWVGSSGPAPQQPQEAAAALVELVNNEDPAPAAQSGPPSLAYAADALRDPARTTELAQLPASIPTQP